MPWVRAVIAGYGFLGRRIAAVLLDFGFSVSVVRRSPGEDATGISITACDLAQEGPEFSDRKFSVAVFCLAPGSRDLAQYESTYCLAQKNFLASVDADHYIYISTTGVYPADPGRYDELSARPHSERAAILLRAEGIALGHPGSVVLRLAGLYSNQRPIYGSNTGKYSDDKLVHFVHVVDAARAAAHAVKQKLKGIYNVHDGNPLWRSEILSASREVTQDRHTRFRRFVENGKFFATGFTPQYHDYFAGIRQV